MGFQVSKQIFWGNILNFDKFECGEQFNFEFFFKKIKQQTFLNQKLCTEEVKMKKKKDGFKIHRLSDATLEIF